MPPSRPIPSAALWRSPPARRRDRESRLCLAARRPPPAGKRPSPPASTRATRAVRARARDAPRAFSSLCPSAQPNAQVVTALLVGGKLGAHVRVVVDAHRRRQPLILGNFD